MTKSSAAAEPSMEEILASIRRIISDGDEVAAREASPIADGEAVGVGGASAEGEGHHDGTGEFPHEEDEVLELTDEMLDAPESGEPGSVGETDAAGAQVQATGLAMLKIEPIQPDVVFENPRESTPEAPEPSRPTGTAAPDVEEADFASAAAAHTEDEPLLSPATDAKVAATFSRLANTILMKDARTLDDLVKEMLRPMLKEWLDDNLPHIVERLVREEIERVSRGRS